MDTLIQRAQARADALSVALARRAGARLDRIEAEIYRNTWVPEVTMCEKYNGWTNYETWNAALWMGNDSSQYWDDQAQDAWDQAEADSTSTREENASRLLADIMKAEHEEYAEEWMKDQASFFADILNAGLSSVNWDEIASHYIAEVS